MNTLPRLDLPARADAATGALMIGLCVAVLAWQRAPMDVGGLMLGLGLVAAALAQRGDVSTRWSRRSLVAMTLFAASLAASGWSLWLMLSA